MIPKIIHYLWLSDEKTIDVEYCLDSWKRNLPDYEIKEWNKSNFPYNDFLWTREAFSKKKWAFVTDFFRLWVLSNYGGIYMDADVTVTGTFDNYLNQPLFIGTEYSDQIGAHLIGSVKGHPFIKECLNYYENRHFIKEDSTLDMKPMPNIITKIFVSKYHYDGKLVNFEGEPLIIDNISIYPDTYFTINTYDGKNVCYHNGLGSWRDSSTHDNPIMEEVISRYLLKKYFCKTFFKEGSFLKRLIMMSMPLGLLTLRYNYHLKIRNNKRVQSVEL